MAKATSRLSRADDTRKHDHIYSHIQKVSITVGTIHAIDHAFADVVKHVELGGRATLAKDVLSRLWATTVELGLAQDSADSRRIRRARKAHAAFSDQCSRLQAELRSAKLESWNDIVALALLTVAMDAMPADRGLDWPGGSQGILALAILRTAGIDPMTLFPEAVQAKRAA